MLQLRSGDLETDLRTLPSAFPALCRREKPPRQPPSSSVSARAAGDAETSGRFADVPGSSRPRPETASPSVPAAAPKMRLPVQRKRARFLGVGQSAAAATNTRLPTGSLII